MASRPPFSDPSPPEPTNQLRGGLDADEHAAIQSAGPPPEGVTDPDDSEEESAIQRPAWEAWAMGGLAIGVCAFGGKSGPMVWGISGLVIGLMMLLAPPARKVPLIAALLLAAFVAGAGAGLLPASWTGGPPAWLIQLGANWGIPVASTLSPQPAVTLEAWLLLAVGALWFGWCLARGHSESDRRTILWMVLGGVATLCAMAVLEKAGRWTVPWWPRSPEEWGEGFGPFANRNHTSSLAAMGAVLAAAAAYDAYRRRSRFWIFAALAVLPMFAAVITNTSRAGLGLFFLGLTVWLSTAAMRKGFFRKLSVSASLIIAGASLVLVFGDGLKKKIATTTDLPSLQGLSSQSGRLAIYSDTLQIAAKSPWLGMGLGNFSNVYPLVSSRSDPMYKAIHPESDWLWLQAEAGLLAVLPLAFLVYLLLRWSGPWFSKKSKNSQRRRDRRLRNAAAIAAGLALLHSLFDMPVHAWGFFLTTALLTAISVRDRRLREPSSAASRLLWRLGGAAVMMIGAGWIGLATGHASLMPPLASTARIWSKQALDLAAQNRDADAMVAIDRAVQIRPLDWSLYFTRAQIHLRLGHPDDAALRDFGRARALEPHIAKICYAEGEIWLKFAPEKAVLPWREFLRRFPSAAPEYFVNMLNLAQPHPELRKALRSLATTPSLQLSYLRVASAGDDFNGMLRDLLHSQPSLEGLDSQELSAVLQLWQQKGDRDQLRFEIERRPEWLAAGWRILADERARESDFKGAYEIAAKFIPVPTPPTANASVDMDQLERSFLFNPTDLRPGVELYFIQKNRGLYDAALTTLDKLAGLPGAPAYLKFEKASIYARKEDYRRAWELLREYQERG